ncbi:hypothetical protein ALCH109712_07685 [Alkalicoccus chagannorensis]
MKIWEFSCLTFFLTRCILQSNQNIGNFHGMDRSVPCHWHADAASKDCRSRRREEEKSSAVAEGFFLMVQHLLFFDDASYAQRNYREERGG